MESSNPVAMRTRSRSVPSARSISPDIMIIESSASVSPEAHENVAIISQHSDHDAGSVVSEGSDCWLKSSQKHCDNIICPDGSSETSITDSSSHDCISNDPDFTVIRGRAGRDNKSRRGRSRGGGGGTCISRTSAMGSNSMVKNMSSSSDNSCVDEEIGVHILRDPTPLSPYEDIVPVLRPNSPTAFEPSELDHESDSTDNSLWMNVTTIYRGNVKSSDDEDRAKKRMKFQDGGGPVGCHFDSTSSLSCNVDSRSENIVLPTPPPVLTPPPCDDIISVPDTSDDNLNSSSWTTLRSSLSSPVATTPSTTSIGSTSCDERLASPRRRNTNYIHFSEYVNIQEQISPIYPNERVLGPVSSTPIHIHDNSDVHPEVPITFENEHFLGAGTSTPPIHVHDNCVSDIESPIRPTACPSACIVTVVCDVHAPPECIAEPTDVESDVSDIFTIVEPVEDIEHHISFSDSFTATQMDVCEEAVSALQDRDRRSLIGIEHHIILSESFTSTQFDACQGVVSGLQVHDRHMEHPIILSDSFTSTQFEACEVAVSDLQTHRSVLFSESSYIDESEFERLDDAVNTVLQQDDPPYNMESLGAVMFSESTYDESEFERLDDAVTEQDDPPYNLERLDVSEMTL